MMLLTIQPILAHASPVITTTRPTMQEWYTYVKQTAKEYNLDPNLCAALAKGESGTKEEEVRFCWVSNGKYHGPYNLARCFLKQWDITDWKVNTRVGIMTLAHKIKKYGSLRAALRKYNTGDSPAQFNSYFNNILKLQGQYEARKIFAAKLTYPKVSPKHEKNTINLSLYAESSSIK